MFACVFQFILVLYWCDVVGTFMRRLPDRDVVIDKTIALIHIISETSDCILGRVVPILKQPLM